MATMAGGSKPLRLKDLLELDCESCSAAGFRCYPRRLCVVAGAAATATTTTSSSSQMRHPRLSSLSKSLSRRLKGGFWRRHDDEEEAAPAPASSIVAAVAGGSSSCCSISDSETSSDSSNSTTGRKSHSQSESEFSSASSDILHAGDGEPSTTGPEHEVITMESKEEEEEADDKEQRSPVGVMDFPFDEDEDDDDAVVEEEEMVAVGVCTPSFSDSLTQLQRRKMQQQPKIRRLGSTVELSGVDLEARFAASESDRLADVVPVQLRCSTDKAVPPRHDDHRSDNDVAFKKDPEEYSLLDLLVDTVSVGVDDVTERLLLDFFVEAKCNSRSSIELRAPNNHRRREDGETLRLAKAWLEGTGTRWNLNNVLFHGEAVVAEMERSRRWMHTGEEEREIGVVVAVMVIDELMHELVSDLIA